MIPVTPETALSGPFRSFSVYGAMVKWEDASLARTNRGFESPWLHQVLPRLDAAPEQALSSAATK